MQLRQATLQFPDITLKKSEIRGFRGFIGNTFREYDLIHNHDPETGELMYRYPLIQFNAIAGNPVITAITDEAVAIFRKIFMTLETIKIYDRTIPINEKNLHVGETTFGCSEKKITYEFLTPWAALNSKNFKKYSSMNSSAKKHQLLDRILIGNIISMAKSLRYDVSERLVVKTWLRSHTINIKGTTMAGFRGMFRVNFNLPDTIGLGKSVSRGFGMVKKVEEKR